MRSINKYTIDVRREGFLKAIRTEQRQQIKARKRAQLLGSQDYMETLWRFRTKLNTLDLTSELEWQCAVEVLARPFSSWSLSSSGATKSSFAATCGRS